MEDVLAPLGVDFQLPGGRFSSPEGCEIAFQRLPGASWGPASASRGHFGRLWAEKGESKNCMDGSWGRLGAILAALGLVLGRLPPPREEARGGSGRSFLEVFSEVKPRAPKMIKFHGFSSFFRTFFLMWLRWFSACLGIRWREGRR